MRDKKLNIIILNHHAGSPDVGSGGRHFDIGKSLSQRGHRVCVLASSYNNRNDSYYSDKEVMREKFNDNFEFIRLKTSPAYKGNVSRFRNYYDYMKKASKFDDFGFKADVVIASSVHPFAWAAGYDISKRHGAKFIVEVRDLWPLSMYEDFSGIMRKAVFTFFEALEKKYYRLADAIITTAPFAYEYMEEKFNIDRKKVFYIPHGIDIEDFDRKKKKSLDSLEEELASLLRENKCITYTGSYSKSEGLPAFVESAKYLKDRDLKYLIVGSGPEEKVMRDIVETEKLTNVHIFGRQKKEDIPMILENSSILFCGLKERKAFYYGISKNKFYDYMAAQKPIIFASSVRGSLIEESKSGLTIKPEDPKNLSETIKEIYDDLDNKGKEYGKNGRDYVEKNHTNEKITEEFLGVIDYVEKSKIQTRRVKDEK